MNFIFPILKKIATLSLWISLFIIPIFYFIISTHFSFNFPYYDDFENIVNFLYEFSTSGNFATKLRLIFEQNYEHRVILSKTLTLIYYLFTGEINIKSLIFIGNLSLIGTIVLLYKYFKQNQLSLLALFAISCLLFQAQHYEDTISWATCALQHAPCLFFSLWSFNLALNRKSIYLSFGLAIVALLSSANGLSTIALTLLIVAFKHPIKQYAIPLVIMLIITFIHLVTFHLHTSSTFSNSISQPGIKSLLFLSFAGQLADPNLLGTIIPSVLLGIVFVFPLLILVIKIFKGKHEEISNIQYLSCAGIMTLVFVGFLIVFARHDTPDWDGYKMDRYKIYSAFFGGMSIAFYDNYFRKNKWKNIFLIPVCISSMLFCAVSYYSYYDNIISYKQKIVCNSMNYFWSRIIYYPIVYTNNNGNNSIDFFLRCSSDSTITKLNNSLRNVKWKQSPLVQDTKISANALDVIVTNSSIQLFNKYTSGEVYLIATNVSDHPVYMFSADVSYMKSLWQFYSTFTKSTNPGFSCTISKKKLAKGNYNLSLIAINSSKLLFVRKIGQFTI